MVVSSTKHNGEHFALHKRKNDSFYIKTYQPYAYGSRPGRFVRNLDAWEIDRYVRVFFFIYIVNWRGLLGED